MKLKYDFSFVRVGDETMGVAVGAEAAGFNHVLTCNETAEMILNLLKNDMTEEQVTACLMEAYDAPTEEIVRSVSEFFTLLRERDLLV